MWTTFNELIKEATERDPEYQFFGQQAKITNNHEHELGYEMNLVGMLIYKKRLYVPNQNNIMDLILD